MRNTSGLWRALRLAWELEARGFSLTAEEGRLPVVPVST